jgi:hypothetical protein
MENDSMSPNINNEYEPGTGYQFLDPHIDYKIYKYNFKSGGHRWFRGPKPTSDKFISCIGAAQTYGRWSSKSYPELLGNEIGLDAYNISSGGWDLSSPHINKSIDLLNTSRCCIVQIMSARCQRIPSRGIVGAGKNYKMHDGSKINTRLYWKQQFETMTKSEANDAICEMNDLYVETYEKLISKIKVPTILLYVGQNSAIDETSYDFRKGATGYPHWITKSTIKRLCKISDHYVEYVHGPVRSMEIKDGVPYVNTYYPTQEMYELLVKKLIPIVKNIIDTEK